MSRLTRILTCLGIALSLTLVVTLSLSGTAHADSFTVDTAEDSLDAAVDCGSVTAGSLPGPDGKTSLREAICAANNNSGPDSIAFSASIFGTGGVITITQGTLTIENDDDTSIDGDLDDDGEPEVEVRYDSGTVGSGGGLIYVRSSNNYIEGLSVTNSPENGVYIVGAGTQADDNQIVNCWLGLDLSGAERGNSAHGVRIVYVAGGPSSSADGNVIQDSVLSGNGGRGVSVQEATATQVLSNTVGLDPSGATTRPNGSSGIALFSAPTTTVQTNLVSGNGGSGIYITGTQMVTITGNTIGLDESGSVASNQGTGGINVYANAVTLTIRGNTISGNRGNGIYLGEGTTGATIAGNAIGTDAAGTTGLGNGRSTNKDGIQMSNAYSNTIGGPNPADRNVIAHNGRAGVFISGEQADFNVVQNNHIGTGVSGSEDLGNGDDGSSEDTGDGGVYLYEGTDHTLVRDNLIRFNYIGLRLSGGSGPLVTPPQHNQVLTNTVTNNDKYGVVNQSTHRNESFPTPADGDNLIQNNEISATGEGCASAWCTGIGVFNYGGSPHIVSNTIGQNKSFGIVNRVYFGTDGPDDAADDLLSMPTVAGNVIGGNGDDGIQSRDTTPLNKATLLDDNTFSNNNGEPHISQRWFVAVEVVSDTETLRSGLAVTITRQDGGQVCPGGPCTGSDFASAGGDEGIWGASGISYTDVENVDYGTTTWFEVIEYEVNWQGNWMTYTSHLVEVGGQEQGSRYFDFDGITTTEEISGEVNLPFCVTTGITGTDHSLCRYQIAQVPVFVSFSDGDWDDDGIPDEEEGSGDSDGDGTPDYQDDDSDNDGIPDATEGEGDSDGDGTPDYLDDDSDDDGIPDATEGSVDSDGDGTPDYRDTDSDNDGIADSAEGSGDTDGDGDENFRDEDSDDDGTPDGVDTDSDNDGIPNTVEGLVDNPGVDDDSSLDSDGDGLPDYLDTDSDGDGRLDDDEYYGGGSDATFCSNPAGRDSDGDGTVNCQDNDVDEDGIPNYLDTDSDDDGVPDAQEPSGTNDPPFQHGDVPAWIDPIYGLYLPVVEGDLTSS